MSFRLVSLDLLQRSVDFFFSKWPQPIPDQLSWQNCKIVSHRGEFDNLHIYENTLPAFKNAQKAGVWGIELDIRWTKDLHPIVSHDDNGSRLFKKKIQFSDCSFETLRNQIPDIPSFEEVVKNFGEKLHLMIEIKKESYPDQNRQNEILEKILHPLKPMTDYHFLSLDPKLFNLINFVPKQTFLTVSEVNTKALSNCVQKEGYGGITGHYLLITQKLIQKHKRLGQKVGTGFIASEKNLFREMNRGVEWIFSNRAVKLQKICDRYRQTSYSTKSLVKDSNIKI